MNRAGQTLVLVLWSMGLLTAAMGVLIMRSTHELRLGQVPLAQIRQAGLAEAAVWHAAAVIKQDDPAVDHPGETWATGIDAQTGQDLFADQPLGGGSFSVSVADEQGKLNLNTASVDSLARLVESTAATADAAAIAAAIADWRDEPVGELCASAQPACHNAPLDSVEEMLAVSGVTPDLYEALKAHVTVYGDGRINVNTASAPVLQALGLPTEDWIEQRQSQPFMESPDPDNPLLAVASARFSVTASARLDGAAAEARLSAVIDREGNILAWHPQ